jgi:hypothetical protein
MMRADENTATLAHLICVAHGIKGQDGEIMPRDAFLTWMEEKEITLQDAMKAWR